MKPLRVVAIDDEEVARYLVRQCLPAPAFDVMEAADGPSGVALAEQEAPDVILLDLKMPGMDGWQVLEALGERERTRDIPVAIVTSHHLDDRERARAGERVFAVISKQDLSRAALAQAVHAAARSRAGAAAGPPPPPPLPL